MHIHNKRLYRSEENKVLFGVMGGLGEYFDIDPVIFRIVYVAFLFFSGIIPGILAYIVMVLIVPKKPIHVAHESHEEKHTHEEHNHHTEASR